MAWDDSDDDEWESADLKLDAAPAAAAQQEWSDEETEEEAKAAKAAEKAAKAAEPSSPKQKKTNPYFLWLNSEGVRDAITKHLATQPGRSTVVKSAEVTKMAGAIWGCMDPTTKEGWTARANLADQA